MASCKLKLLAYKDVEQAAARISGEAVLTPLLSSARLDKDTGLNVFVKAEVFQNTGSFKFRGALNRLRLLTPEERRIGVVAWSSGNHAQGVAAAAAAVGTCATVVMPTDAPAPKINNARRLGANVVFYDRNSESREEIARAIADKRGATIVPSFDDPHIIAGQGTCGLEIANQVAVAGAHLDCLLVPCGGGGLAAGISIAVKERSPRTQIYAVEPEGYDDHVRSLISGRRERADMQQSSICDALLVPMPGDLTWQINRQNLAGGIAVGDSEVRRAMRYAFDVLKLVVEPGGAVALAAVMSKKIDPKFKTVGIVLSGANVDPALFCETLREEYN